MNLTYTIGFIYCGISVICAVILLFDAKIISETNSKYSISRFLFGSFVSAGLSALFDCAFALREMEIVSFSQSSSYILTIAYVIFSSLIGMFWVMYSEKKQNSWFAKSTRNFSFILVPFLLILLFVISTPFTHWYFYFDENHYQRGSLFSFISVVLFVFIIQDGVSALIRSFNKINYLNRNEYRRLFVFSVFYVSIQFIQLVLPDVFPYRTVGIMLILNIFLIQNMKEMIGVDSLTRINNRFEAERYLENMIDSGITFEVAMIDVDKFKSINDNYGHLEGDKALQYVANSLKKSVPRSCFIARMSGDEFIIVNNDIQTPLLDVESKINANLNVLLNQNKREYKVTVSVGIATKDSSVESIPDIIKLADNNLYIKKEEKKK